MTEPKRILCIGMPVRDLTFGVQAVPGRGQKFHADRFAQICGGNALNAAIGVNRLGGKASPTSLSQAASAAHTRHDTAAGARLARLKRDQEDQCPHPSPYAGARVRRRSAAQGCPRPTSR